MDIRHEMSEYVFDIKYFKLKYYTIFANFATPTKKIELNFAI